MKPRGSLLLAAATAAATCLFADAQGSPPPPQLALLNYSQAVEMPPSGWRKGTQPEGFGASISVSLNATVMAIGDLRRFNDNTYGRGDVFVYAPSPDGSGAWSLLTNLTGPGGGGGGTPSGGGWASYGAATCMSADGSTLFVGAPASGSLQQGLVAVWRKPADATGPPFRFLASFSAPASAQLDQFGSTLACSGDGTAVAAGSARGAFVCSAGSDRGWSSPTCSRGLLPPGVAGGGSGTSGGSAPSCLAMSADGNTVLMGIGSYNSSTGIAAAFNKGGLTGTWDNGTLLMPPTQCAPPPGRNQAYGQTCALSSDGLTALIGAPGIPTGSVGNAAAGRVVVYAKAPPNGPVVGPNPFVCGGQIVPRTSASGDRFGAGLAIHPQGAAAMVGGVTARTVFRYDRPPRTPTGVSPSPGPPAPWTLGQTLSAPVPDATGMSDWGRVLAWAPVPNTTTTAAGVPVPAYLMVGAPGSNQFTGNGTVYVYSSGSAPSPSPSPAAATSSPSASGSASSSASGSASASSSASDVPGATASATMSYLPATGSATASATASASSSASAYATSTASGTSAPTETATATGTSTSTATAASTSTATSTAEPSASSTRSPIPTPTATATASASNSTRPGGGPAGQAAGPTVAGLSPGQTVGAVFGACMAVGVGLGFFVLRANSLTRAGMLRSLRGQQVPVSTRRFHPVASPGPSGRGGGGGGGGQSPSLARSPSAGSSRTLRSEGSAVRLVNPDGTASRRMDFAPVTTGGAGGGGGVPTGQFGASPAMVALHMSRVDSWAPNRGKGTSV